jgi:bifunctional non-homologous end joining protein LigD
MKASLGSLPADDAAWAYEVKWDGYRVVAHIAASRVRLQSSRGLDYTDAYPEIGGLAAHLNADSAIIDGELVVLDGDGRPSFEMLQRHETQVAFYAFDVLQLNGVDTIGLPYEQRRALLSDAIEPGSNWMVPAHVVGGGAELLAASAQRRLEGIIAKRLGSIYSPGARSANWRKVKNRVRVELVLGGWTLGSGSRSNTFGSLVLGRSRSDGTLRFAGAVGTGFTQRMLDEYTSLLRSLRSDHCPFRPPPPRDVVRQATWMRPKLSATVEIAEFTNAGLVRHPTFISLGER